MTATSITSSNSNHLKENYWTCRKR